MVPSLVANDGIVYVLGGRSGVAALAVRAGGSGDVTKTHRLWTSKKGANVSSPVFFEGHLYWANEATGTAFCAEAATGEVVYEERLPRADTLYASALLADGRMHYLARDGRMFVVAAKPEFELVATNDLKDGSIFHAAPVAIDGRLFVRSNRFLYCLEKK
jgi:outer membrane protein assembly factor BamB